MIIDCHWHTNGDESPEQIAEAIENAGLDKAVLFAPYNGGEEGYPGMGMEEANRWLGKVVRQAERAIGFAWIEPTLPGAVDELDRCVNDYGLVGVKMIPNHWYPTDPAVFPVYEKIQQLGLPVIFHAGILYGYEDGSRFCRPALFEALINFPGIRFALAHIGWPWVDECLAVFGRFQAQWYAYHGKRPAVKELQMYIDMTPGAPPAWRAEALRKAVAFVDAEHLLFGSDTDPSNPEYARRILEGDREILSAQLGLPEESRQKILGNNMSRFLGRCP